MNARTNRFRMKAKLSIASAWIFVLAAGCATSHPKATERVPDPVAAVSPQAVGAPTPIVPPTTVTLTSDPLKELGVHFQWEDHTLPNGLRVILVRDPTAPVIAYQTWFKVGSVDEKPGLTGLAHLFEHLMFKGTPKYGANSFLTQLEARGAEVNAYTTRDYTVYHETFTPELLEKVIDMESDRMSNLVLSPEIVTTEKQVVLEERRLRVENSPGGKMQEALWALSYQTHPYRFPTIGIPDDVINVPLEQVIAFYRQHYQPGNATIIAVGNFDPAEMLRLITTHYGPIAGRARPARSIPDEPEAKGEKRLVIRDNVASPSLVWSFRSSAASNEDTYALDVLSTILFDGTSSRAYQRLEEELDWVLGISGMNFTPTFPGIFSVSATMKGNLPPEMAEKELERMVRAVQAEGVTEKELERARRILTVQLVQSLRSTTGLANLLGTVTLILGDPARFQDDLSKYAKVTADQVQAVARKYLVPNSRTVVTLLPNRAADSNKGDEGSHE